MFAVFLLAIFEDGNAATALYVINNLFFSFSIAINSYFQKKVTPKDIAPSMAVGFTINLIAAVALPVTGGILWTIDWRIPFVVEAVFALCSLVFCTICKSVAEHKQIRIYTLCNIS